MNIAKKILWCHVAFCQTQAACGALLLALVLVLACDVQPAYAWTGYVVRIEDGSTIVVSKHEDLKEPFYIVRFYGIDAPTRSQPYGKEALQFLMQAIPPGSEITVEGDEDEEKSPVRALVQRKRASINYELIAEGLAWVNRSSCKALFCRRWFIQEHNAVQKKKGIWSLNVTTPPWQWGR